MPRDTIHRTLPPHRSHLPPSHFIHHLHSSSPSTLSPLSAPAIHRFSCIHFLHLPGCYSYVIWFTSRSFLFRGLSFVRPHIRSSISTPNCRFKVHFNCLSVASFALFSQSTHSFPSGSSTLSISLPSRSYTLSFYFSYSFLSLCVPTDLLPDCIWCF